MRGIRWESSAHSVTFSSGGVLNIETTAIAAQALVRASFSIDTAHKALQWLVSQKDEHGAWRSTQATVHALRALLLAAEGRSGEPEKAIDVAIRLNGQPAQTIRITPDTGDVVHVASLGAGLRRGSNALTLESDGAAELAYQIVETHHVPWTAGSKETAGGTKPLRIHVAYDSTEIRRNDVLRSTVTVDYGLPGVAQMVIVDLGIPAGFEVIPDGFDALKQDGVIERYSLSATQITLYIRSIASGKPLTFQVGLRAKYPVRVKAPPSSTYLYYTPEIRDQTTPREIVVL